VRHDSAVNPTFPTRRKKPTINVGTVKVSTTRRWLEGERLLPGAVITWRGLRRQNEFELLDEEFLFGGELGVAAEDKRAAVGGRKVHVKHLHSGELVEYRPWAKQCPIRAAIPVNT
jgi:hypothetical protein